MGVRAGRGPPGPPSAGGNDLVTNYYKGCSSFQLFRLFLMVLDIFEGILY